MKNALQMVLLVAVATAGFAFPAASAAEAPFKIDVETPPAKVYGKQHAGNDVWIFDTGSFSCDEVTYSGNLSGKENSEISLTPAYSGCKAFGLFSVPVDVNGCEFKYTSQTRVGPNYEAKKSIVCFGGQKIEITAPGCTVTVGSQAGLGNITLTNVGAGATREITFDENISSISYEEHRPLFGICANKTAAKTNGSFVGADLQTATSGGAHTGLFVQ